MRSRPRVTVFCLSILAIAAVAVSTRAAELPAVSERMRGFIAANEVAGAVTMVVTKDRVAHLDAAGYADVEKKAAMGKDSIFWIASMTKPVTGVAAMMMQDEGKLSIDDPVSKHIPELAGLKTADGKPANITIRHLLTHTSGMGEISGEEAKGCLTLADAVKLYATKPVGFEPGSKWQYCQSGINTAARVVEVVSKQGFAEFLDERLFKPLGMADTTFYLSEAQLPRLVTPYRRTAEGTLVPAQNFILMGKAATSRDRFPAANGGLFSTATDYARFCQMILNEGTLDGRQYLKPETVKLMTRPHTGELKTGFTTGNSWGIGWCIVREPQGPSGALSPNSFGHGGAYGTQAWIDPAKGIAYILMVQRANFPNADASDVRRDFQNAAAAGVAAAR